MKNKDTVYVLKKVKSEGGKLFTEPEELGKRFYYPRRGWVEAKDWEERNECGGGLHGLEWGCGNFDIEDYGDTFVVLKVDKKDGYINLGDKVKFRKGYVAKVTKDSSEVMGYIRQKDNRRDRKYNYSASTNEVTNQGYKSTSNQEDWSTSNQGNWSTSNQGYGSTSNQGDGSTSNQEYGSVAVIYGYNCIYRNSSNLSMLVMFYEHKMYHFEGGADFKAGETIKVKDGKIIKKYKHTDEDIRDLEGYEVFVFGSNERGDHVGGAAKVALKKFGAVSGVGEGLKGQSYAFPTLDMDMKKRGVEKLKKSVDRLISCANGNTDKIFLVTKIGCGIAGYKEKEMIKLFDRNDVSANIVLPKGWRRDS